jgi:hypothetical protein
VLHHFKINGKHTPLIQPGKTAKLIVTFEKGSNRRRELVAHPTFAELIKPPTQ